MGSTFGTKLKWNGNYVAGLTVINGIQLSRDSRDITTHNSSNQYEEVAVGLKRNGEVTVEGFFSGADTNGQVAMMTDFDNGTLRAGVIEFPSTIAAQWQFNGYLTNIKVGDAPVDGELPFTATIKPTGKPSLVISESTGMSALTISNSAVLAPAFAIGTFTYVATVLTGVTSVTVTPTAASHTITVTANGASQTVTSGQASSAITLGSAGSVTPIVIEVQESGKIKKTYTIYLTRA